MNLQHIHDLRIEEGVQMIRKRKIAKYYIMFGSLYFIIKLVERLRNSLIFFASTELRKEKSTQTRILVEWTNFLSTNLMIK
jgi:Tfp pilus assembly PilM family ATPase